MFTVHADTGVLKKLADLLHEEGKNVCIRLREYTLGAG